MEWQERLEELERRNARLERTVRRTRIGAAVVALAGLAVLLAGAGEKVKVVEVQEVRVVDKSGKLRVSLTANPASPGLALFDEKGKEVRGSFLLTPEGSPVVTLRGGDSSAKVSADAEQGANVVLTRSGDGAQSILTAGPSGAAVAVKDGAGQTKFRAP